MITCKNITTINKELREEEMPDKRSCRKEDSTLRDTKHPKTNNSTRGKISAAKVPPTKRDGRKFFVGGLPGNVTDDEFREFFEAYGTVIDSIVMIDRETRRSRGFGFVTFADKSVAEKLLGGANKRSSMIMIRGKSCEVKNAEPKKALNGQMKNKSKTNNNGKDRSNHSENNTKSNQSIGKGSISKSIEDNMIHSVNRHKFYSAGKDEGTSTYANNGKVDMNVDIYREFPQNAASLYPPPYHLAISAHMATTSSYHSVPFQNSFPHVQPPSQRVQDEMVHSSFHVYSPYPAMVPDHTIPIVPPTEHGNKTPFAYPQLQQNPVPYYYPVPVPRIMPFPWVSPPFMPNTNHQGIIPASNYNEMQESDDFPSDNVVSSSEAMTVNK